MTEEKQNGQHVTDTPRPTERVDYAQQPEPRRSHWWIWLIVLAVVGVAVWYLVPRFLHSQSKTGVAGGPGAGGKGAIPVITATARKGDLPIYLTGLGTVIPLNTVTVRTRVDGQIDKIGFSEGQTIKEGDLLFQIDPRPFQVQLDQAKGTFDKDQANLENAKRDLERYKTLVVTSSVTQQQLDTQAALVNQYQGVVESDKAQVASAQLQLTYSRITAPISGRLGLKLVDQGNIVHQTDTTGLIVLTQLQPITVVFTLPQDMIAQVQASMSLGKRLEVDAYDRNLKTKITVGKLVAVDNQVDLGTGTLRFKAEFANTDDTLFANEFVNARMLVDVKRDAVIVPTAAVQRSPDSTFVFIVKSDETVDIRPVTLGPTEGDFIAVEAGLSPGDVVVTDGVDKLQSGSKVTPHAGTDGKNGPTTRSSKGHGGAVGTTRPAGHGMAPAMTPATLPTTESAVAIPTTNPAAGPSPFESPTSGPATRPTEAGPARS